MRNGPVSVLQVNLIATNSLANDITGSNDLTIRVLGSMTTSGTTQNPAYWAGRCACAYLTDGTLSSTEVADLHSLLNSYLISPTGR